MKKLNQTIILLGTFLLLAYQPAYGIGHEDSAEPNALQGPEKTHYVKVEILPQCWVSVSQEAKWSKLHKSNVTLEGVKIDEQAEAKKTKVSVNEITTEGDGEPLVVSFATNMGNLYKAKIFIPSEFLTHPASMEDMERYANTNKFADKNNTIEFQGRIVVKEGYRDAWHADGGNFDTHEMGWSKANTQGVAIPLKHFKEIGGGTLVLDLHSKVSTLAFLPGTYTAEFKLQCIPK